MQPDAQRQDNYDASNFARVHVIDCCSSSVLAETITKLILERASHAIFTTFVLELQAFRLIPVICPARRANPGND